MSVNPYAPPVTTDGLNYAPESGVDELAGRFTRFASAFVDGILMMGILMPIQFVTGFYQRVSTQTAGIVEQFLMSLLGMAVMLALNGYLLFTRGQTIGKVLTKIQIVDFKSGNLLPFLKVYVYRYLWTLPLLVVVVIIPGAMDDLLVNIVVLIDALLIFGAERRCLHDYIAGSKVVLYRENRQKIA
jgi:uncharacterized RDD family membrane protein YckC